MSASERRRRQFEQVIRLRRAERAHPDDQDIVAVRAGIERELGPTVSLSLAGDLLGVSHTTVRRWVVAEDLPTVEAPDGRRGVPVQALLKLYEQVERQRATGERRLHVIEPIFAAARERAERLDPRALLDADTGDTEPHERARLRSLVYHRAVARHLARPDADDALHRVWVWRADGRIDERYADLWEEVLRRPLPDVRDAISADTDNAADLRQTSPFAGTLSEAERRKILQEIR